MKLFNKKHSEVKTPAWRHGYDEGLKLIVAKNPYNEGTDEYFDYEAGWFEGETKRLSKK